MDRLSADKTRQDTPEQDRSGQIAAAAIERLAAEGHLTQEEAERLRSGTAPQETPEGNDLSPMLSPEERLRGHRTISAAQLIGRIMLMFSGLMTALIGSRAAMLEGGSLGCFGLLLKAVALLASAVILGWTALPLAAGMLLGLILARLARKKLRQTPPDTAAYKRLIAAAFLCEGLGTLIAVAGLFRLFVIGDGIKPFTGLPE